MISIWHMAPNSWEPGSACRLVKYVEEGGSEMPDIAACQNEKCPSQSHCYRFVAVVASCHQVYAKFTVPSGQDRCDYYIPAQMELPLKEKK